MNIFRKNGTTGDIQSRSKKAAASFIRMRPLWMVRQKAFAFMTHPLKGRRERGFPYLIWIAEPRGSL